MQEIVRYRRCFVCGDDNRQGLQAKFYRDGDQAVTELVAQEPFEGYRGIYHGGILSTLLDEVMIKAILARDVYAVTVEIKVRYHRPVSVGDRLRLVGRITKTRGRLYTTEGEATGPEGELYASAVGKYIEARPELRKRLAESIDQS